MVCFKLVRKEVLVVMNQCKTISMLLAMPIVMPRKMKLTHHGNGWFSLSKHVSARVYGLLSVCIVLLGIHEYTRSQWDIQDSCSVCSA